MAFVVKSFFEKFSNTSNISIKVPKTIYIKCINIALCIIVLIFITICINITCE